MRSVTKRLLPLAFVLFPVLVLACATEPTGPHTARLTKAALFDGDPIPCDSTIVIDGTCRGGYIIPH